VKIVLLVSLNKGGVMKKYLFGLGAMLVGAGLMFVLMHGEVSADSPILDADCHFYKSNKLNWFEYCQVKDLTCVIVQNSSVPSVSCVKS
jgi:hypothetical protein